MSYFIFLKDQDNVENTIYRIAENELDFDNLNLDKNSYKILEDSQLNFNLVKYGNKCPIKYKNNEIIYVNQIFIFKNKNELQFNIDNFKQQIKQFTNNNLNHLFFNRWNDYFNQLNNLDLNLITYPLNKSLEQYFNDLGQPSYNILQLP